MKKKLLTALITALFCFGAVNLNAQEKTIKGSVTDNSNEPVIGANVVVKGDSGNGTFTDINGEFTLLIQKGATLIVSAIGYETTEYAVTNDKAVKIIMNDDTKLLDGVVITALGITRKEKALGYASQSFDGENLQKVKGVNIATSLTGQISGMTVYNSTEFNDSPDIRLRGESPLIVVDGVPTNQSFDDFNQDVIENITVLKGATASALYGSRGGSGAIMITTKKGGEKGFHIDVNTSNMFFCGYNKIPTVQSSYSGGSGGKFDNIDYVWGAKLDAGVMAEQWNPITKQYEMAELTSKGKDNLKNFMEFSFVSNTSVSASVTGDHGSVRASLAYMRDKSPYPNTHMNKYWFNVGGELKLGKKAVLEATLNYTKENAPNYGNSGYGTGYMYNIMIWTGSEYDLRDYKDYWIIPNEKQNWPYTKYYDNPYFSAYEKIKSLDNYNVSGSLNFKYDIAPWVKFQLRAGGVSATNRNIIRSSVGTISVNRGGWNDGTLGYYEEKMNVSNTFNYDALFIFNKAFGDFTIDGVLGASLYTYDYKQLRSYTKNGLSVPGFYSLNASNETPAVEPSSSAKQVGSVFGTVTLGWKEMLYLDVTGRNDWSSTLPADERSYFYPSVGLSFVGSELAAPGWMPFWKLRGSWTTSKKDLSIYELNQAYSITQNVWNGLSTQSAPSSILAGAKPITDRTWEIGANLHFLKSGRIKLDVAYFNKLTYNNTRSVTISSATGYSSRLMNINEDYVRKGFEITLSALAVKSDNFSWNTTLNFSSSHKYFASIDEEFSAKDAFTAVGNRVDYYAYGTVPVRDPATGQTVIQSNGLILFDSYKRLVGYSDPDFEFGFINSFQLKDFSASLNFDGRVGGVGLNTTEMRMFDSGTHPDTDNQWRYDEVVNGVQSFVADGVKVVSGSVKYDNYGNIVEDTRVFAPNDVHVSYEKYIQKAKKNSDWVVQDRTFIKLREATIGYNLPKRIASKIGMSDLYIGVVGQNLFCLTKDFRFSDPDSIINAEDENLYSPSVRYVGFNLKLGF